jgi:hypothetical protein
MAQLAKRNVRTEKIRRLVLRNQAHRLSHLCSHTRK